VQVWRQAPMGARHGGWLLGGNRWLRLAGSRVGIEQGHLKSGDKA
jgi:hypothetical protein